MPAASIVSSAVTPCCRQAGAELGDRLAVDQDVGGVRAVRGDDRAVGDERSHGPSSETAVASLGHQAPEDSDESTVEGSDRLAAGG